MRPSRLVFASFLLAFLSCPGLGLAGSLAGLRDPILETPSINRLKADRQGVRTIQLYRQNVAEEAALFLETSSSSPKQFGAARVNLTLESKTEFRLETGNVTSDRWITRVSSSTTQQDIGKWGPIFEDRKNRQSAYTISHGWVHRLTENLSMELFMGVAGCRGSDGQGSKILPTGELSLTRDFGWGSLTTKLGQDATGHGGFSGVYGSQTERRVSVNGRISLTENLNMFWDCGFLLAQGAFRSVGMVKDAPIFLAGVGMEYSMNDTFSASVQYTHRRLFGPSNLLHGFEGPAAYASLRVLFE